MTNKPEAYKYTGQTTGRPTKYRPEYCQRVVEMGKEGKTPVEWADELDVHRSTFNDWRQNHPEFSKAYARAREACQAWWIIHGRKGVTMGKKFNDRQWKTMVYNLFREDWQDERSINVRGMMVNLDINKLPDAAVSRIAAGESPMTVVMSMIEEVRSSGALPPGVEVPEGAGGGE